MKKVWASLRARLLAGLLVVVPVVATVLVLRLLFGTLDQLLGPPVASLLGREVPGLGIGVALVFIFVFGSLATNLIGRRILHLADSLFASIPLVRNIYKASRDILHAVATTDRKTFKEVVLIEYPTEGRYSYGFVTSYTSRQTAGGVQALANVFIPSSPVPTTGPLVALPVERLVYLDMSIDEALRLIVSGGIVSPPVLRGKETPDMKPSSSSGPTG